MRYLKLVNDSFFLMVVTFFVIWPIKEIHGFKEIK